MNEYSFRDSDYRDSPELSSDDLSVGESSNDVTVTQPLVFFINDNGSPLHFIICHTSIKKQTNLKKFIEDRAGIVSFSLKDFGPHSAVLIEDNAKIWTHNRDVFNLSYIDACVKETRIVDITPFLHYESIDLVPDFPYMDIFYYKKINWFNIPAKYKLATNSNSGECMNSESFETDQADSRNDSTNLVQLKTISRAKFGEKRRTHMSYSIKEKEAILKYIVEHDLYEHVKGVSMWKEMEAANICPIRTWQSMKEHALKTLSKELHKYQFLTSKDRNLLHLALCK